MTTTMSHRKTMVDRQTEHDHKAARGGEVKVLDDSEGIVEAIVSVTAVLDDVGDIIEPGAYKSTLASRVPKGVYSHDWDTPVAKTLLAEELMPGDPRLPAKIQAIGGGGLLVKMQFNLDTQRGREAYSDVKFYGDGAEWSIGYVVNPGFAKTDTKTGIRSIKELELFEYSPVLFGANAHTATVSVKSDLRTILVKHFEDAGIETPENLEEWVDAVSDTVIPAEAEAEEKADTQEEESAHDYVPSQAGDDGSPCDVCGLPATASIHDDSKEIPDMTAAKGTGDTVSETPTTETQELEPADGVSSEDQDKGAETADLETTDAAAAVSAEAGSDQVVEPEAKTPVVTAEDVKGVLQQIDALVEGLKAKFGIEDEVPEPEVEEEKGIEWTHIGEVTRYSLKIGESGQPYIESFIGEEKGDPWFPHVYETGGEQGMCALCGKATDDQLHIPLPAGMPTDQLNPTFPGAAKQPADSSGSPGPTASGPLDPPAPQPASQPAGFTGTPVPAAGGQLNPTMPKPGAASNPPLKGAEADLETTDIPAEAEAEAKDAEGEEAAVEPEVEAKVDVALVGSFEDTTNRIGSAVQANLPNPVQDGADRAAWVEATYPDHVLVGVADFTADDDGDIEFLGMRYFSYSYTAAAGVVNLGTPEEVEVAGVVSPKTAEPEALAQKAIGGIENKVGRTLSGTNAEKIRNAVQALIEVLGAAGIEVLEGGAEKSAEESPGLPAFLLMQNDLLRLLADG